MTPAQLRMARAALKLTVREVEKRTGVNKNTVARYEAGREILASALQRLEKLFLDEGVKFLDAAEAEGEGVRLTAPSPVRAGRHRQVKAGRRNRTGE